MVPHSVTTFKSLTRECSWSSRRSTSSFATTLITTYRRASGRRQHTGRGILATRMKRPLRGVGQTTVAVAIAYLLAPVGREVSVSKSASTYLGTLRVVSGDVSVSNLPGAVEHYVADVGQHGQIHRDLEAFVTDCEGNTHRHRWRDREESLQGRRYDCDTRKHGRGPRSVWLLSPYASPTCEWQ